ncbi:S41 family peptidase [Streptomyces sp. NPDC048639]|uniref:S41 family peptidase n=1 Tax=Streptomyces sp. NPDC048639 TaxID=3365581 RepID=UPI003723A116
MTTDARRHRRTTVTALALATVTVLATTAAATACGGAAGAAGTAGTAGTADAVPPERPARASVQGVWRTDGYGTIVAVEGRRLRSYETTRGSCLPGALTATRSGPVGPDGGAEFAPGEDSDYDRVTVTPEPGGRTARLRIASSVGDRVLHRLPGVPRTCEREPADDPRAVFDVFWRTYAENYPFFAAKGIDWNAVRDRYRPRVTAGTTDDQLFAILRDMIEPLHDTHTGLIAGKDRRYAGHRQDTEFPTAESIARIDKATAESVGAEQRRWAQGALSYADLPGRIGYLRITRFAGFTDKGDYASAAAELDKALDSVLTEQRTEGPERLRGLVIDLRFNGGGSDRLGVRLASRLTDRPYIAYTKHARNDPDDPGQFTPGRRIRVRPHGDRPVYSGPVAVLTGRLTVSAGETFTQALMGRTPAPTRIGENTQGAFSDTLDRTLPNGWSFILPNEEFRTAEGTTFDGAGIPPDIRTPVFTDEEFAKHRDSALARARALLTVKSRD